MRWIVIAMGMAGASVAHAERAQVIEVAGVAAGPFDLPAPTLYGVRVTSLWEPELLVLPPQAKRRVRLHAAPELFVDALVGSDHVEGDLGAGVRLALELADHSTALRSATWYVAPRGKITHDFGAAWEIAGGLSFNGARWRGGFELSAGRFVGAMDPGLPDAGPNMVALLVVGWAR